MHSLRTQLLLSHLFLVALMGIVMGLAISSFFRLSLTIDEIALNDFSSLLAAQKLNEATEKSENAVTFYLVGHPVEAKVQLEESLNGFKSSVSELQGAKLSQTKKTILGHIDIQVQQYQKSIEKLFSNENWTNQQKLSLYFNEIKPLVLELKKDIRELRQQSQDELVGANRRAKEQVEEASMRTIILTFGSLGFAVLLAMRMVRLALTPLAMLAKQADVIASGKPGGQVQLDSSDEIGALADSFNQMATRLAELRQSEVRRLRRAERMSDAALEHLYDPVIVTDPRGRIVHLNRAAEGLFGSVRTDPRTPIEEHIHDPAIIKAIHRAIQHETISAGEDEKALVKLKSSGAERTYRLRATPMFDEESNRLGAVAVLEDVTHMREVDRMKTEFLGVASHELRTPVTSLLLSSQLLEEEAAGPLTEQQKEIVEIQRLDLERLERLMRELLDVTRLEAGSSVPRFEWVEPKDLLENSMRTAKQKTEEKDLDLNLTVMPGLCPVRADVGQISRVFINLVENAVRHTPPGGAIEIRAFAEGNDVTFEVEDSGDGIPPEYLKRIFERFVQVPGATQGGAGLGLSIANLIVKAHGSELEVESELGKGSCFRFQLPCKRSGQLGEDKLER